MASTNDDSLTKNTCNSMEPIFMTMTSTVFKLVFLSILLNFPITSFATAWKTHGLLYTQVPATCLLTQMALTPRHARNYPLTRQHCARARKVHIPVPKGQPVQPLPGLMEPGFPTGFQVQLATGAVFRREELPGWYLIGALLSIVPNFMKAPVFW